MINSILKSRVLNNAFTAGIFGINSVMIAAISEDKVPVMATMAITIVLILVYVIFLSIQLDKDIIDPELVFLAIKDYITNVMFSAMVSAYYLKLTISENQVLALVLVSIILAGYQIMISIKKDVIKLA